MRAEYNISIHRDSDIDVSDDSFSSWLDAENNNSLQETQKPEQSDDKNETLENENANLPLNNNNITTLINPLINTSLLNQFEKEGVILEGAVELNKSTVLANDYLLGGENTKQLSSSLQMQSDAETMLTKNQELDKSLLKNYNDTTNVNSNLRSTDGKALSPNAVSQVQSSYFGRMDVSTINHNEFFHLMSMYRVMTYKNVYGVEVQRNKIIKFLRLE